MKILSVNVSLPKEITHNGRTVTTCIFKEPVDGRVMLRTLNLDGDGQADLVGHGGEYKAAYVYASSACLAIVISGHALPSPGLAHASDLGRRYHGGMRQTKR